MVPGKYNIITAANALWAQTFTIGGITTAVGYSARMDLRTRAPDSATLLLSLTSGAGLTLTSDGSALSIAARITASQMDTLLAALEGRAAAYYSLRVTPPAGADDALQYLVGTFTIQDTPTP